MIDCGLANPMGLPNELDREEFIAVSQRNAPPLPPLTAAAAVAALLKTLDDAEALQARLKMSGLERDTASFAVAHRRDAPPDGDTSVRHWQWLVADFKENSAKAKELVAATLRYRGQHELAAELEAWAVPKFPVSGHALAEAGCPRGPAMSVVIKR